MKLKIMKAHLSEHMNELKVPLIGDIVQYGKDAYRTVPPLSIFKQVHVLIYSVTGPLGEPGFAGVCLEYSLFCWETSDDYAAEKLSYIVDSYTDELSKTEAGREQLFRQLGRNELGEYWALYRQVSSLLGEPEDPPANVENSDVIPEAAFAMVKVEPEELTQRYELHIKGKQEAWDLQ